MQNHSKCEITFDTQMKTALCAELKFHMYSVSSRLLHEVRYFYYEVRYFYYGKCDVIMWVYDCLALKSDLLQANSK